MLLVGEAALHGPRLRPPPPQPEGQAGGQQRPSLIEHHSRPCCWTSQGPAAVYCSSESIHSRLQQPIDPAGTSLLAASRQPHVVRSWRTLPATTPAPAASTTSALFSVRGSTPLRRSPWPFYAPVPVCPYANTVHEKPSSTSSHTVATHDLNTSSCVANRPST